MNNRLSPLEDEDLLQEILLRLPPEPSSFPWASLVCKRLHSIFSDPQFLRRFRKYHQKPSLLGFFDKELGHRGLSFPGQETTVSIDGHVASRHVVYLRSDDAEVRRFMGADGTDGGVRRPTLRRDGWWEVEMGPLSAGEEAAAGEEVAVSFEMLGWHPKRGLVVEGIEFRPL